MSLAWGSSPSARPGWTVEEAEESPPFLAAFDLLRPYPDLRIARFLSPHGDCPLGLGSWMHFIPVSSKEVDLRHLLVSE